MYAVLLVVALSQTPEHIKVSSPEFTDNAPVPSTFTCEGAGISPPLAWSRVPAGTRSIAILVDDPDAPHGVFTHWLITNLPPTKTHLDAGETITGASYTSICPVRGRHHYRFHVYALDTRLPAHLDRDAFINAITDHVLATGELVGTYERG